MKSRVVIVNRELGWFAVQQGNGDVTVVDGLGDPLPRLDDVIEGNLSSSTREMLSNRTTSDALIVRIIGTGPTLAYAAALMQRGRVGIAGVPVRMMAQEPSARRRSRLASSTA